MRILLDASVIIYLVETIEPFVALTKPHLKHPDTVQVCSDLARLECRVKPLRDGQQNILLAYDNYFTRVVSEIVPLSRIVVDRATVLRAQYGFKTPDALHLAAALESGCAIFLTNDHRLDRCREIQVVALT